MAGLSTALLTGLPARAETPGELAPGDVVRATRVLNAHPASSSPVTSPVTSPSTSPVDLPVGDLPGWHQVLAEDFDTDAPAGTFPGAGYSPRWTAYDGFPDTSGRGTYSLAGVSVHDGTLDLSLGTVQGRPRVAAPVPLPEGRWGGWTYGRYVVRFRADPVPGYKTAWLLWPDSDVWAEGEIDFPEGDLDGTVQGFVHQPGDPVRNALAVDTGVGYQEWHTAAVDWTPAGVTFTLDGRTVSTTTVSPSHPMHLVLQTETSGNPPASAAGHVLIDWVALYRTA